jgi:hypothetical protein
MGGPKPVILDASMQSLAGMLRVLKVATETYLGAEVSNATVTMPFPIGHECIDINAVEYRLEAAASALNLKLSTPSESLTEITWKDLEARRRKRSPYTYFSCHPDDQGLVLGIEFNDAALSAMIQAPQCFDGHMADRPIRTLHSAELGVRELFKADNWRDKLVDALRDFTALPIRGATERDQFNMLVLLGDSARDERLLHALQDALGDQYDRLIVSAKDDGTPAKDPLFRGAASAAHSNWHENHYWTPYREHGCSVPGPHSYPWATMYDYVNEAWNVFRGWLRNTEEKKAEADLVAEQERKRLLKELAQYPIVIGAS